MSHPFQTKRWIENLSCEELYEESLRRWEGRLAEGGALVVETGQYTGRSPNDKFIVRERETDGKVWWGPINRPIEPKKFDGLYRKAVNYLKGKEVFVQNCYVGADRKHALSLRVITEFAWHSLFARNMFVRITDGEELARHEPEYTVLALPGLKASPKRDGTNSEAFIIPNFDKRTILIGGTRYAGEIKKSVFTLMNFLLPQKRVLPMHCSANTGPQGDTAVFFGLSGTGKTTLSADPERSLIGDDEHGWSDTGVFNFEGGCYAKVIRLSPKAEPDIYATTRRFGTVLENVVLKEGSRELDLDDDSLTENTRASYPIDFIRNTVDSGVGGHPRNIIFLTCDAFGVLPPVARLKTNEAMYHFLSGYTAKVAGTERGIKEPVAVFSACFGAPFMPLHPGVYAKLLGEKVAKHRASCWLVNTGWTGGSYGVGKRISISDSRVIIRAILDGTLTRMPYRNDPLFNLEVPQECPGLAFQNILSPRAMWKDPKGYDLKAKELAALFHDNFRQYASQVPSEILEGGPA